MSMTKGENRNAPPKGSSIKVQPIQKTEDINKIKALLKNNPRNLCLFTLGINTNLRASDLCRLKVSQVKNVKPMQDIEIKEKKTGKTRRITLNKSCVDSIGKLLNSNGHKENDYLFVGQRGRLCPQTIHALVKSWAKAVKLKGNYGSHSLRKTWGYHQRVTYSVPIPILMTCFNHNSQKQTLDYLCVQPEEVKNVYGNMI